MGNRIVAGLAALCLVMPNAGLRFSDLGPNWSAERSHATQQEAESKKNDQTAEDESLSINSIKVNGTDLREYVIVLPKEADRYEKYAAAVLNDYLETEAGYTLTVEYDTDDEAAYELLIGGTSREESVRAGEVVLADDEYILSSEDGRIVMEGESYMIGAAVSAFVDNFRPSEEIKDFDFTISGEISPAKFEFKAPNSAILIIGDGMGKNHVDTALKCGLDEFTGRLFENVGESITYSFSSDVTDSAAGGTALSSGYKTINGYVGMDPGKNPRQNVRELAAEHGAATAVITTDAITGATPGAFTVHVDDRHKTDEIAAAQAKIEIDYIKGSIAENELVSELGAALRNISKGGKSFFIMAEEAHVDINSHDNNADGMINSMFCINETIAYAAEFVLIHPDTVLIVTADHETGGVRIKKDGSIWAFSTYGHTGVNVPIYALGYGTEIFKDTAVENTKVAEFAMNIWK